MTLFQSVVAPLVAPLVAVVFPSRCPGCGKPAEPICDRCAAGLRRAPDAAPPSGVDAWSAPLAYEGAARELIARVKYHGRHASLQWLATVMVRTAAPACLVDVGTVTWVPTDIPRRRRRGFDHAHRLARLIGAQIDVPVRSLLVRNPGAAQTQLGIALRRQGPDVTIRRAVSGAVLLIDDVSTTGASLRACAMAIRAGGATRVTAITAARTPVGRSRPPPTQGPSAAVSAPRQQVAIAIGHDGERTARREPFDQADVLRRDEVPVEE